MLIQKQVKSKSQTPLLIVLGLVMAVTGVVFYRTFVSEPSIEGGVTAQLPRAAVSSNFDTSVLEDVRLQSLRTYGSPDVQVTDRGRNANPFLAF